MYQEEENFKWNLNNTVHHQTNYILSDYLFLI